jgi:chaperone modulatory protein CbpM
MRPPYDTRRDSSILGMRAQVQLILTVEELANVAGISVARLERLVHLGVIEPAAPGAHEFTAATAGRLRRMLRLHADLGVNFTGAAIVVELLDRLEQLETELRIHRGDAEREP